MTRIRTFSIARDFSRHAGPRLSRHGTNSGEDLRRLLADLLESHQGPMTIDMDGTNGMGSSFIDEAFGGLVREDGMDGRALLRRLRFSSILDPSYAECANRSIESAMRTLETKD